MKTTRYTICMAIIGVTFFLGACADSPLTPKVEENPPTGQTSVLGLMQVTIKGIGTQSMSAVIRPPGSRIAADLTTPSDGSGSHDGSIQYKSVSVGSFTYGDRATDGVRYIYAAFKVRNADASGTIYSTARQNLTFLAVDTDPSAAAGETYEHTAVSELRLYNGDEPANVNNLANNVIPTGWVALNSSGNIESFGADVSQIFTENEVQDFEDTLPTNTEVTDIFPYGFIVRTPNVTPGSRALPSLAGDTRAVEDQFDGVLTFAFKIPLQTVANQDPFEITMLFLAVDDSKTRITRSIEEALYGNNADFEARAMELNANPVTLLGNTTYNGTKLARTLCDTRVAGPEGSPMTTLNAGSGCNTDTIFRYYVDEDATTGTGDGLSWVNAFTDLQSALAIAGNHDEIWVAEGVYYPDEGFWPDNDRNATFTLENGVAIYGGFDPSVGADTFAERDWQSNETSLSGDIDQNDGFYFTNNSSNAYHVVIGINVDNTAILDGFGIIRGNANGSSYPDNSGGGIFSYNSSPTLANLLIRWNTAASQGGGIFNYNNSSPLITNVIINVNKAGIGGGIQNVDSSPVLTNVIISGNHADIGGGISNRTNSSPKLSNVKITLNTATNIGGGIQNVDSSPVLTNVIISGNNADIGGGISNNDSSPVLVNVTISGNSASNTVIAGGAISSLYGSVVEIHNSIIWNNAGVSIIYNSSSALTITNSTVGSGCTAGITCTNVTSANPLFVDATGGDYTLQAASPAIDAGDNSFLPLDIFDLDGDGNTTETIPFDLAGNARVVNGTVDQGAYEKQ